MGCSAWQAVGGSVGLLALVAPAVAIFHAFDGAVDERTVGDAVDRGWTGAAGSEGELTVVLFRGPGKCVCARIP